MHLKAQADLLIFRGAGWEAEGRVVVVVGWGGLGCDYDNDERPGEISYEDPRKHLPCPA